MPWSSKLLCLPCSSLSTTLMIDNTTAVYIINNMGTSHSDHCHSICVAIWEFCISHKIWLTAAHLPRSLNVVADKESRQSYSDSEWMIDSHFLQESLINLDFKPEIDLFASRLNKQFPVYCSYRPDPGAKYINAFSISWANLNFYSFPPFSCVLQVVQKIIQDKAKGVIVVPNWPTQAWYSLLQPLLVKCPQKCKPSNNLVHLPTCQIQLHPLYKKLELHICLVSGKGS